MFNQADLVQETTFLLFTLGDYSRSCMVSKAYLNLSGLQNETGNLAKTGTFISFLNFCFCPQTRSATEMKETNSFEFLKPQKLSIQLLAEVSQPGRTQVLLK